MGCNTSLNNLLGLVRQGEESGPRLSENHAAVVVVLDPCVEGVRCLFVRRRSSERDPWSGQIAFPGGRWAPGDSGLLHTACRELREETGLEVGRDVDILGWLGEVSPSNVPSMRVRPYLALLRNRHAELRVGEEVDEAILVQLNNLKRRVIKIYAKRLERELATLSYLAGPRFVVWGLTARILTRVMDALEPYVTVGNR